jgi:hypothetical protein
MFTKIADFGGVETVFENNNLSINEEFFFLQKKIDNVPFILKFDNLNPSTINRYYLIKDDTTDKVFKGTPIISLNPKYIELKFEFIKLLIKRGLTELNDFTQEEKKVRNKLLNAIVDQFDNNPIKNKTSIKIKVKNISDKEIEEGKFSISKLQFPDDANQTKPNSPKMLKKEIGGNSEYKITISRNELNKFRESRKNMDFVYDSSQDYHSHKVLSIENLLPIFIHKNEFGNRPNALKNPKETSFLGPIGIGLPFNNFTSKTYLFGK